VQFGDVIDQLHDHNVLPTPAPPNAPTFAAFEEGTDQVNHFDASGEDLGRGALIHQRRRRAMNGQPFIRSNRALFIHRFTGDVKKRGPSPLHLQHGDRSAGIRDFEATL